MTQINSKTAQREREKRERERERERERREEEQKAAGEREIVREKDSAWAAAVPRRRLAGHNFVF